MRLRRVHVIALTLMLAAGLLGAVAIGASGTGTSSVLVPIPACRLADTRPAPFTVGSRSTPVGPGETVTFAVTGTNGDCTIPSDATAIASNVTTVNPTAGSYLTVFPADATRPNSSNLNWTAPSPPVPNQVTVGLSSSGEIKVFNLTGTIDVIIDVVGYYVPESAGGTTGPTGPTGATGADGGARDCTPAAYTPGINLANCDLGTVNLNSQNLSGANLAGAGADVATIVGGTLRGANLAFASFDGDASGAMFNGAILSGATMFWTLDGADLGYVTAAGVILGGQSAQSSNWAFAYAHYADFTGVDLTDATFYGADAEHAYFNSATLAGTSFIGANARYASFTSANLTGANLSNADLTGAEFALATLTSVTWASTICPDGTNSDSHGNTCVGHL